MRSPIEKRQDRRKGHTEVLQEHVIYCSVSSVRFKHHGLISTIRIDVPVFDCRRVVSMRVSKSQTQTKENDGRLHLLVIDVRNGCISAQATERASTRLITPDLLDEHVACGRLNRDTFVSVGHFDVVNPYSITHHAVRHISKRNRLHWNECVDAQWLSPLMSMPSLPPISAPRMAKL